MKRVSNLYHRIYSIFADVVNDFKEQILKEVGKRAKAEGSAKKAEYKNTIDSLKAEVDKL